MSLAAVADRAPQTAAGALPAHERAVQSRGTVIGFIAMIFGMFMAILDIQIVAASVSEIQAGLSASADEISWVQTSYLIAEVVMIPLSGYLTRAFSTRWVFALSCVSFTAMSVMCALADSIESMIVYRALQGFLGGAMIPTAFATSWLVFPPKQRTKVNIVTGLVVTLAPTIGPTLGGYLTTTLSWHWLFLINVVPGILVTIAVWALIDIDRPNFAVLKGFDLLGLVSMALFLGSLEYVLEEGTRWDWFDDPVIRAYGWVAAIGGAVFFARVLTYRNPIVDLSAFKNRQFCAGIVFSFVLGIGLYGLVYVLPLFLGRVRHLDAQQIGMIVWVTGVCQFLGGPLCGMFVRRIDARLCLAIGYLGLGLSTWWLTEITNQSDFWELLWPQVVRGLSIMFCIIPGNFITLGMLQPQQLHSGSGLYNLIRNLGGAFGLAGINTVMTMRLNEHWAQLGEHTSLARANVQAWLDQMSSRLGDVLTVDPDAAAAKMLGQIVLREATVMAFADVFGILAIIFAASALLVWFTRRPPMAALMGRE